MINFRFNAVYKNHNIRVMATNEAEALEKLIQAGFPEPLQFIKIMGIDSHYYKLIID